MIIKSIYVYGIGWIHSDYATITFGSIHDLGNGFTKKNQQYPEKYVCAVIYE